MLRFKGHIHRFAFAATVLLSLLAFLPAAFAQVTVRGNSRVDSETIRSYFTGSDNTAVNQGVKDLYATGLFSDVRVSRAGKGVVITVNENKIINRVAFEGNSKVKAEQLQSEITSKSRGPYSTSIVNADIERIKDVYRRSGRAAASVTSRTVDLPNGRLDVVFTINEGDKTGVKTINFVGNTVYSGGKLRDLMNTTEMNYLSFFKSSDVYDPEKIGTDLELIRRFYLKNGYADFRVVGSDARFDAAQGGYIITITVEEGPQYIVGSVTVDSHNAALPNDSLLPMVRFHNGDVYNGDLVEKTVEAMTREVNRRGYAFSQVKPRGDRDPATRTVAIVFTVEDGPRVYIERIVIKGNTRTRDYVIRREFEIGEGDAYNKVLIDKAERRLNGLGFFKKVKITNEAGSSADRVVVVVDVEDQPTGSLSVSGGYSTTDGIIAELAVTETNFLGRGQYVRTALTLGQRTRGIEFNFTEPYFLDQRLAAGFDLFAKKTDISQYSYYDNFVTGGTLRLGVPVTDEVTFSPRYSIYRSQISIPNTAENPYNDCNSPVFGTTPSPANADGSLIQNFGTGAASPTYNCLTNGEASIALKQAAALNNGVTVTSSFGYTLSYNTIDNNKNPTSGILAELRQDIAGAGGDSKYVRTTGDIRYYHEVYDQIVGIIHLQGGDLRAYGGNQLRIVDNFNLGPTLVRGFAPSGIGPRDIGSGDPAGNPLGGTEYFGASAETQFPIWGIPRDLGIKGALFADAGTLFGYHGQTDFSNGQGRIAAFSAPTFGQGNFLVVGGDTTKIRSSVGASIIWQSPLGPIRFDFAKAITKDANDQTQFFRFSGGATF
ncbi:outer membrane protein assembly factor BamA [Beijerinckia sp. L45]|uniref:outer membrane protein assembly factor BamA n=1 Tax=Beijerinckia sp. L45 TaxID=1641855 RepID=UPI00131CD09A|nr:outer membrane protein assembly factor BamA [Beijerinckia sp. L45]